MVCHEPRGNVRQFTCAYHGWTFETSGELKWVPLRSGYEPQADQRLASLALPQVARVALYRGFIFASLAALAGQRLDRGVAADSVNLLPALLGQSPRGRQRLVLQAGSLSLRDGNWKYIEPSPGQAYSRETDIELGNAPAPQLYDLGHDPGERINLAERNPDRTRRMANELRRIREARPPARPSPGAGSTRPALGTTKETR
jgi:hypothetical protein